VNKLLAPSKPSRLEPGHEFVGHVVATALHRSDVTSRDIELGGELFLRHAKDFLAPPSDLLT